jgi:hypothetical protein
MHACTHACFVQPAHAYHLAVAVRTVKLPVPPACRERNDGLYRVITYLVAKMVEELGIALLNSIVFGG